MKLKGFLLLAAVAAVTAALWPATGSAANFRGIVVAKQHGTLLVASPAGLVQAASGNAAVGSRVVLAGGHATVVGHASKARIRGVVVRRIGATVFIASNRHLLALHKARVLADTTPTPATTAAAPGTVVSAQVAITNGQLDEQDETTVGQVSGNTLAVQATIAAVAPGSVTLNVQGQTLTVPLPGNLTLPASLVGQTVTVNLSLAGSDSQGGSGDQSDDDNGDNSGNNNGGGGGGD
jgi:hypothetical protein